MATCRGQRLQFRPAGGRHASKDRGLGADAECADEHDHVGTTSYRRHEKCMVNGYSAKDTWTRDNGNI